MSNRESVLDRIKTIRHELADIALENSSESELLPRERIYVKKAWNQLKKVTDETIPYG